MEQRITPSKNPLIPGLRATLLEALQEAEIKEEELCRLQAELEKLKALINNIQGVLQAVGDGVVACVPKPLQLKKPEYKQKGYIKLTVEDLLPCYPEGASMKVLVDRCFDYGTDQELEAINASYRSALNKAVADGLVRREVIGDEEIFCLPRQ
jgi:hypothetical protein